MIRIYVTFLRRVNDDKFDTLVKEFMTPEEAGLLRQGEWINLHISDDSHVHSQIVKMTPHLCVTPGKGMFINDLEIILA